MIVPVISSSPGVPRPTHTPATHARPARDPPAAHPPPARHPPATLLRPARDPLATSPRPAYDATRRARPNGFVIPLIDIGAWFSRV
eukprot:7939329-Pyramimonas_sp.AAC.1